MDFEDEYDMDEVDEFYDHDHDEAASLFDSSDNLTVKDDHPDDLDPLALSDPEDAYLLISDDAQDELGLEKEKMRCLSCRHLFVGDMFDRCPRCMSYETESAEDLQE